MSYSLLLLCLVAPTKPWHFHVGDEHHENMPIWFWPLKPHFYIEKLGLTEIYIIFLISAQNIYCEYSLEPPRRGGSNENPQSMIKAEIRKILDIFLSEIFPFVVIKFSIYLNSRVFVMALAWFVACVLSVCLFFLLMSLVGFLLWLSWSLGIFHNILDI